MKPHIARREARQRREQPVEIRIGGAEPFRQRRAVLRERDAGSMTPRVSA